MIDVFVPGLPKPGGSKRAIPLMRDGRPILRPNGSPIINVVEDSNNRDWRQKVAFFAKQKWPYSPLEVPLSVEFHFVFPRPASHFGTGKNANVIKPSARPYPSCKPDTTKLIRSCEDSLTGVIWLDDALIVKQVATKSYGQEPGVRLIVEEMVICRSELVSANPVAPPLFQETR
jgi:Holliday junction resolvase RusA-like endonuclease